MKLITNYIKPFLLTFVFICKPDLLFSQSANIIPENSSQIIMVLTDSVKAVKGTLYLFDRSTDDAEWTRINSEIPVVLGRSGLGWGRGLNKVPAGIDFPFKQEGDGRSPAGVFELGPVFGYASAYEMKNLKMPYLPVSEFTECIDDINSRYYNEIVSNNKVDTIDWSSSEKMSRMGIYYKLGIVVEHNSDAVEAGSGSCIFLHNWANPDETMAGCTAMAPGDLKKIINLLDETKNPLLVQLTTDLYKQLKAEWDLPEILK